MALKLDRLSPNAQITGQGGVASSWFSNLWQRTMSAIEGQINSLVSVLNGTTPFTGLNVNGDVITAFGYFATGTDASHLTGTLAVARLPAFSGGDVTSAAGSSVLVLAPSAKPFGFGFDKDLGVATPSAPFVEFASGIQWTLAAGLSNSVVLLTASGTAPTATTVFDLQVGGVSVGSITFASGSHTASLTMATDHTVTPATTVQIVAPASLNGMAGRLYGSIVGVRG